jgi:hypothetical protein
LLFQEVAIRRKLEIEHIPRLYKAFNENDDDDDDNSIQFFIIYVPSQQLQGQLQTQHSADTSKLHYGQTLHKIKD